MQRQWNSCGGSASGSLRQPSTFWSRRMPPRPSRRDHQDWHLSNCPALPIPPVTIFSIFEKILSGQTEIQWCDSTVNPAMGCDGCELWVQGAGGRRTCYAGILHERRGGKNIGFAPKFEIVTEFPGRMAKAARWPDLTGRVRDDKPWLDGLPRLIFVSDMGDALSAAIGFDYLKREIIDE